MDTLNGIGLRRNPYWTWLPGLTFTDIDGRIRATWQLVSAVTGECRYCVDFADGIPIREDAPEAWTQHMRIGIRDEVTHHERTRIGAP